ncbi:MAG TPA: NADH-quinone oxidoreductase subunit N [Solirubrobacteraceae bacterium]|nr:NADH-quinone oxidoreductase subunit N [Solirubrobacteraceae bacterium]
MTLVTAAAHIKGPHIDWAGLSPLVVLAAGALLVLLVGLLRGKVARERVVPLLTLITLGGAMGTEIWRFTHPATIIHGALRIDDLALLVDLICSVSAIASVILAWRSSAPREAGEGEFHSLLLFSVMGMAVLASAQDIITLFLGLELLSIPLYILCAAEFRREGSLESGLKYLIIGSVGSATLLYGLAMIYGATGQTGFANIAASIMSNNTIADPLVLGGIALTVVGLAFKASVAPFHQWTPDVYEGAPTAITAFMATATKAAALAIFLRFFDVAMINDQTKWAPMLAALAAITMIVGNVGALGQTSMKRLLGYSGVAQAGYMLSGVVVGTRLGVSATVLYLGAYLAMNIAAFAVVQAVQTETGNDRIASLSGLGKRSPALAFAITVAMLALAGVPGTVGFVGKFQLIHALVDGGYSWLAIVLVVGAMISLGYYLKVVAAAWMSPAGSSPEISGVLPPSATPVAPGPGALPPIAGGAPEADRLPYPEVVFVAVLFAALALVFGIIPQPLFHLASHAGAALSGLF